MAGEGGWGGGVVSFEKLGNIDATKQEYWEPQ
jgi:hypothetical protein